MSLDLSLSRVPRRAAVLTGAALAVASLTGAATGPACAVPVAAAHTRAAAQDASPLTGAGMTLDLESGIDLEAHGITATAVGAAAMADHGVRLKVGKNSKLVYRDGSRGAAGKAVLVGGIQLAKGGKKITISKVAVDLKSGTVTAQIGTNANATLGAVNEPHAAEFVKEAGTTAATLRLAASGITLAPAALHGIGTALGTDLSGTGAVSVDADLDLDVDLARGNSVNADLVVALGLDGDIDVTMSLAALRDLSLDVHLTLS